MSNFAGFIQHILHGELMITEVSVESKYFDGKNNLAENVNFDNFINNKIEELCYLLCS